MIIVTANVGLLPFQIGKKRAYLTDKRVGLRAGKIRLAELSRTI
jgi:hypothetical protein